MSDSRLATQLHGQPWVGPLSATAGRLPAGPWGCGAAQSRLSGTVRKHAAEGRAPCILCKGGHPASAAARSAIFGPEKLSKRSRGPKKPRLADGESPVPAPAARVARGRRASTCQASSVTLTMGPAAARPRMRMRFTGVHPLAHPALQVYPRHPAAPSPMARRALSTPLSCPPRRNGASKTTRCPHLLAQCAASLLCEAAGWLPYLRQHGCLSACRPCPTGAKSPFARPTRPRSSRP